MFVKEAGVSFTPPSWPWDYSRWDSRAGDTHMEGELTREVIHAAGVHEAEGVPHGFSAQHALACDGADATVGESGCHDAA